MNINWALVIVQTKKLFLERLQKKPYWSKNQCYKLYCECHDDASFEIADRYAENVQKSETP